MKLFKVTHGDVLVPNNNPKDDFPMLEISSNVDDPAHNVVYAENAEHAVQLFNRHWLHNYRPIPADKLTATEITEPGFIFSFETEAEHAKR
jgi:hypothetical protein